MTAEAPSNGDGAANGAMEQASTATQPVDGVALARLYGEPLFRMPTDRSEERRVGKEC